MMRLRSAAWARQLTCLQPGTRRLTGSHSESSTKVTRPNGHHDRVRSDHEQNQPAEQPEDAAPQLIAKARDAETSHCAV